MCHCMPLTFAHYKYLLRPWDREQDDVWSHAGPLIMWSMGLEFCPKCVYNSKRWGTHYPCSPAWTDMLTGTHSHALCLAECSVLRLLHRERFQYPHPLPHTAEITISPYVSHSCWASRRAGAQLSRMQGHKHFQDSFLSPCGDRKWCVSVQCYRIKTSFSKDTQRRDNLL